MGGIRPFESYPLVPFAKLPIHNKHRSYPTASRENPQALKHFSGSVSFLYHTEPNPLNYGTGSGSGSGSYRTPFSGFKDGKNTYFLMFLLLTCHRHIYFSAFKDHLQE
jgi:hypothetical protein